MSDAERPVDELAAVLRKASRGADPGLSGDLARAARADQADAALVAVVTSALRAGTHREDVLKACDAARLVIRTRSDDQDDQAEDRVLEVMDRLTGWCHPDARL
jgi:hypothetical protein